MGKDLILIMNETIYVKLLNENITVYRPVSAEYIADSIFKIVEDNKEINDEYGEVWEFNNGDIVICDYDNKVIKKNDTSKASSNFLDKSFSLLQLSNIIQWSGLKTVEEISRIIFTILENNQEWNEYQAIFKNLEDNVNNNELKNTSIPAALVSNILDALGMVVFFRKNTNNLSSLSYERKHSPLRLCHEWAKHIRRNGFDSVMNYSNADESIIKTSDALLKYGYEIIEKVYERTNASLD